MRKNYYFILLLSFCLQNVFGQQQPHPTVRDLKFLIGSWEVNFDWYDTHVPDSAPLFSETGIMTCTYELLYDEEPKFIFCKTKMERLDGKRAGQKRETLEMIQWSRFSNSFARTGVYSNWPSTGVETFHFDPNKRVFQLEGTLGVQEGMTEQYAEVHQFSEDYQSFTRRNVANFSDMPVTEYNLTMICQASKK